MNSVNQLLSERTPKVKKIFIDVRTYNNLLQNPNPKLLASEECPDLIKILIDVNEYEKLIGKDRALLDFYKRNYLLELASNVKKRQRKT
jgi:hypothetical protein